MVSVGENSIFVVFSSKNHENRAIFLMTWYNTSEPLLFALYIQTKLLTKDSIFVRKMDALRASKLNSHALREHVDVFLQAFAKFLMGWSYNCYWCVNFYFPDCKACMIRCDTQTQHVHTTRTHNTTPQCTHNTYNTQHNTQNIQLITQHTTHITHTRQNTTHFQYDNMLAFLITHNFF